MGSFIFTVLWFFISIAFLTMFIITIVRIVKKGNVKVPLISSIVLFLVGFVCFVGIFVALPVSDDYTVSKNDTETIDKAKNTTNKNSESKPTKQSTEEKSTVEPSTEEVKTEEKADQNQNDKTENKNENNASSNKVFGVLTETDIKKSGSIAISKRTDTTYILGDNDKILQVEKDFSDFPLNLNLDKNFLNEHIMDYMEDDAVLLAKQNDTTETYYSNKINKNYYITYSFTDDGKVSRLIVSSFQHT